MLVLEINKYVFSEFMNFFRQKFYKEILSNLLLPNILILFFTPIAFADVIDATNKEWVKKGEYIAAAGNCQSCHTVSEDRLMAGGVPFLTPFGTIFSTNITPDIETGIGNWTLDDFSNAMRRGLRPGGEHLYPVFPYSSFTKLIDEDIKALFIYLKSLRAISYLPPKNNIKTPFNIRSLMAVWKMLFFREGELEYVENKSDQWNRGAYIVESLSHCGACHTPRNIFGAKDSSRLFSGGTYQDKIPGGLYRSWFAPNLTSSSKGLGLWSYDDLFSYLKYGRNHKVDSFGPMNKVIFGGTNKLNDHDINSMVTYLKELPPSLDSIEEQPEDSQVIGRGRTIYNLHCGTCHLPTGLGDPEMAPQLNGGSLVVRAEDPSSLINVILYGPEKPNPVLPSKWFNSMEEFQYLLDDDEVAALATFIRSSWDIMASAVTPEQVARQR